MRTELTTDSAGADIDAGTGKPLFPLAAACGNSTNTVSSNSLACFTESAAAMDRTVLAADLPLLPCDVLMDSEAARVGRA